MSIGSILNGIPYTIVRSRRRKTSQIRVGPDGVEIRIPFEKQDADIIKMLVHYRKWILEKYQKIQADRMRFKIRLNTLHIIQRTSDLAHKIGVTPTGILIKHLKTRWGSATSDGIITINSRLLKAPDHVVDYVIIHELCHLKVHDHSGTYWNLVEHHAPKYTKSRKWLEEYGQYI